MTDDFSQLAMQAGVEFLSTPKDKLVHVIGHNDADGLCAVAILKKALGAAGYRFKLSNFQNLDNDVLSSLEGDVLIFADIGATHLDDFEKLDKQVIVLDHHEPVGAFSGVHINPHVFGINEKNAIAGAGVAYFFALGMSSANRSLAYIAIIGAIGDTQGQDGFAELNNTILQHAIIQKSIFVGQRIRLYGLNSRPLIKALEYSTDIDIPGVTNNPRGVKELLDDLHIEFEYKGRLKKFYHLRDFEQEALTDRILELKGGDKSIIVPTYTLTRVRKRELQDVREFATVINACGRLEEFDSGINAVLGDANAQDKAVMNLRVYRGAIRQTLKYVDELREEKSSDLIETDNVVVLNLRSSVRHSIIGIIASILARNKHYGGGVVVCTLGKMGEDKIKISLRVSRDVEGKNLNSLLESIVVPMGGTCGGHDNAAGAVLPSDKESEFVEKLLAAFK